MEETVLKNIKVSIIVPVYNVERFLPKCLDSLVNQTLEEIEILVVNDGSPDHSQAIIDDYASRYPEKIQSFIKENGGLSDARNYGVQRATGEYIGFIDSDDYAREDMFELLYNRATEDNSDVAVCNYCLLSADEVEESLVIKNVDKFNQSVEASPQILLESKSYAWNKIYRRDWYLANNFAFPVGQWFEDSAVIYNMLYLANKVSAVVDSLYIYRIDRDASITNVISDKVFEVFQSTDNIHSFFYSHTSNKKLLEVVDRLCQIHALARLNDIVGKGSLRLKIRFYKKMLDHFDRYMPNWSQNPYYKKLKKNNIYLKIRHRPVLMYLFLCLPNWTVNMTKEVAKKLLSRKSRKKGGTYISKSRLRELQLIELDILKDIDKICKEHNITYYLGEGSLLGAIRHQGFIPWDDDLDIVMPRADYDRFLSIVNDYLGDKYACLNKDTVPTYYLPFSKIVSLNDYDFINKLDKFDRKYSGPFVDIFPLDFYDTTNSKEIARKYKKIRTIRDMLLLKAHYMKAKRPKQKAVRPLAKILSYEYLHKILLREMTKCDASAAYCCNFASSYHPSKQIVRKEVYGEPRYVPFEDGLFPVPHDAEGLLTTIYGNYMKMPPIRKRKSRHSFYDPISAAKKSVLQPIESQDMETLMLEEVRSLQLIELDILKEVDRVCRENDITYYLGEGTLLGAIRHQGFIPWEGDAAVLMPREDLEKFMQICNEKLKPNYKFQYYHNVPNYWEQAPKVRLLDKTEFNQSKLKKYTADVGPYITIFPLDYTSEQFKMTQRQDKYIKRYRLILSMKTGLTNPKSWKQRILRIYARFLSVKAIHEKMMKMATKYNSGSEKYLSNFGSSYRIHQETYPAEVFGQPKYVKFEDTEFPVPSNYQYVLTTTYGKYMEFPPENKRVAKHSFE